MNKFLTILFVAAALNATAQNSKPHILTLDEAVTMALKNNHDLFISVAEAEKAQNSATLGNAGALPSLRANAGVNYSNQNSDLEFATGQTQVVDAAQSASQNASLVLSQVLFAGGALQNTFKVLKKAAAVANLAQIQQMQMTVAQTNSQYYAVALLTQTVRTAEENVQISTKRFERAQLTHSLGGSNNTELLSAEVDLNRDKVSLMDLRTQLNNAQNALALLIGMDEPFVVNTTVGDEFAEVGTADELVAEALRENKAVLLAKTSEEAAVLQRKLVQGTLFPNISGQVSYGLNRSQAEAGFLTSSQQSGLNAGVSLTYDLFGGGRSRIQRQNAQLDQEIAQRRRVQAEETVTTAVENAYEVFINAKAKYALEKSSAEVARQNFQKMEERYALGQVSNLQLREAQVGWMNAVNGQNSALFQAKNAQIALWQLLGKL